PMAYSSTLSPASHSPSRLWKLSSLLLAAAMLASLILVAPMSVSVPQFISPSPAIEQVQPVVASSEANFANQQDLSAVLYQAFAEGNNWVMMNQAQQFEAQF